MSSAAVFSNAAARHPIGVPSSLSSDCASVVGMFGLAYQVAAWRTNDGHYHLVYNRGSLNGAGNSLQLATGTDGVNYTNVLTFAATDANSNADFVQSSSTVWWGAYGDNAGNVRTVRLVYASSTWTIGTGPETITLAGGVTGKNPTVMLDGATTPTLWVAMLCHDSTNGDYGQVFHRTGPAAFNNTTIKFATPDISAAPERSFRIELVPGGMFLIYTRHGTLNYRRHNLTDPIGTWGAEATLYNDPLMLGTYQSRFSVATDASRNLHVAYAGGGRLLNFRWDAAGTSWSNQFLTPAIGAAMVQACVSDSGVPWLLTQDQYANVQAFRSLDAGLTYVRALTYGHPTTSATRAWRNPRPRVFAPIGAAPPPLLLEYTDVAAAQEGALAYV